LRLVEPAPELPPLITEDSVAGWLCLALIALATVLIVYLRITGGL
jgi:hypothetical protein